MRFESDRVALRADYDLFFSIFMMEAMSSPVPGGEDLPASRARQGRSVCSTRPTSTKQLEPLVCQKILTQIGHAWTGARSLKYTAGPGAPAQSRRPGASHILTLLQPPAGLGGGAARGALPPSGGEFFFAKGKAYNKNRHFHGALALFVNGRPSGFVSRV